MQVGSGVQGLGFRNRALQLNIAHPYSGRRSTRRARPRCIQTPDPRSDFLCALRVSVVEPSDRDILHADA